MNTLMLLTIRYDAAPLVPAERVRADYFAHLSEKSFNAQLDTGKLGLPVVRASGSQKAPRAIPLVDLARYVDEQSDLARRALKRIRN